MRNKTNNYDGGKKMERFKYELERLAQALKDFWEDLDIDEKLAIFIFFFTLTLLVFFKFC